MVVAPKGPSYLFSPWEAPDRARRKDVCTGLTPKDLLSLGGNLGGGKSQTVLGKPPVKVVHSARAAQILPRIPCRLGLLQRKPRFPQKPQFGVTASLLHSVQRAPAHQMVVRLILCPCLEGARSREPAKHAMRSHALNIPCCLSHDRCIPSTPLPFSSQTLTMRCMANMCHVDHVRCFVEHIDFCSFGYAKQHDI